MPTYRRDAGIVGESGLGALKYGAYTTKQTKVQYHEDGQDDGLCRNNGPQSGHWWPI